MAEKKFDEYMLKCARPMQDYIAHIFEQKVDEVFTEVFPDAYETKFKKSDDTDEVLKMRMDLKDGDYKFNIEHFKCKTLIDEMSEQYGHLKYVVFPTVSKLLLPDALDADQLKHLTDSIITMDPGNSSFLMFNPKDIQWSENIRDNKKRIHFTWVSP